MKFQILSHAGLLVENQHTQLICDPWLIGSSYWRSWWNYPPVSAELVNSLQPDYIYLTHIHWDHFHGPSLRKLGKHVPIIIPKTPGLRMRSDLEQMGFEHIIELRHGERFQLAEQFHITSYHFSPFLDSCLMIETDGGVLFNSNDAKMMGAPLRQILKNHPKIDFVFRSHSSANSRLCYEFIDQPMKLSDDLTRYARDFADFCVAVNATYAIPFASNQCYLHQDVVHFNDFVVTPSHVQHYFEQHHIEHPVVKVMLSGDSWSSKDGFDIQESTYFSARENHLQTYRDEMSPILEEFYLQESKARVDLKRMEKYFQPFFNSIPFLLRRLFKNHLIVYVVKTDKAICYFSVDVYRKRVMELDSVDDKRHLMQIHVPAFVLRHCLVMKLFSHLPISKRVVYRIHSHSKRMMVLYGFLFNLYEYELIPLRQLFSKRVLQAICDRWREGLLYGSIFMKVLLRKKIELHQHLPNVVKRIS